MVTMGKLNNKDRKKPTANTVKKIVTNGVKKPLVIGLPFQQQKSDVANTKDTQIVTAYNNKKKDSSSGISNKLVSNSHNHNSQKNTKNNFKKVEKDSSTGKTAIKKEVISTKKDKKTKVDSTTIDSTVDEIDTINKRRWWELPIDDSCLPVLEDLEDKPWYTLLPPFINKFHTNNTNNNTNNSNNSGNSSANKKFLLPKEDDCPHIKAYLESLYKKEVLAYYKYNKNNINSTSNNKFMKELINAGTISDRIAALTLKVQESPLHNLESLELLILMTTKKEIRVTQLAIEAIKDLLINNILPTTRKLYSLSEQPLLSNGITISANTSSDTNNSNSTENRSNTNSYRTLLLLYYENEVKKLLVTLVAGLENGLKSNIEYHKKFIINMITELLISIPEQEQKLLYLLINKFSDPSNTIISKVIESLKYIISKHNNMKNVIIYETKQFIYRSNNKLKSIYNTIIFFNQIKFDYHNSYDHLNALALIECYLSLFEKAISEKENGSRLLSGLLSGINKAFPYLTQIDTLHKYINSIFRIIHTTNFTTATQALMVLSHIAIPADSKSNSNSDGTNKIIVTEESKSITTRYYRALYATLFSDQLISRSRNTLYLNLLYRSIKKDPSERRAAAFLKRLAITACQSPPPITAGMLFIISEIFSQRPRAVDFLLKQEVLPSECTDSMIANSQNHDNDDGTVGTVGDGTYHFLGNFDAAKREPEYAVTDTNYSSASNDMNLWELSLLQSHYHPSVKAFSSSLLNKNNNNDHRIVYKGDPIQDFSLMAFLNRFSYKNPKTSDKIKGTHTKAAQEEPINLMDMNKLSSSIAGNSLENSDKQFFVKYFEDQQRLRDLGKTKKRSKYDNTDVDEESDEEAEIDKFADKLAQDLLRSAAANDDPDMDDFSDEDEDINMDDYVLDKDEGSDEESDVRDEIEDVDVDDDDSDVDFDEEIDGEEDSGSDDGFELQAYGDDDEEEEVTKSSKKEKGTKASKKRKTVKDDEFASAEDYEQEMEEIVQQVAKKKVKTDSR